MKNGEDDPKQKLTEQIGKAAADALISEAKRRIEGLADGVLASGEAHLAERQAAADAASETLGLPTEREEPPVPEGPTAAERAAAAREELARLRAGGSLDPAEAALARAARLRAATAQQDAEGEPTSAEPEPEPAPEPEPEPEIDPAEAALERARAARRAVPGARVAEPLADDGGLSAAEAVLARARAARGAPEPVTRAAPELADAGDPWSDTDAVLARARAARGLPPLPLEAPVSRSADPLAAAEEALAKARAARGATAAERVMQDAMARLAPAEAGPDDTEAVLRHARAARGAREEVEPLPRPTADDPFGSAEAALARARAARGAPADRPARSPTAAERVAAVLDAAPDRSAEIAAMLDAAPDRDAQAAAMLDAATDPGGDAERALAAARAALEGARRPRPGDAATARARAELDRRKGAPSTSPAEPSESQDPPTAPKKRRL